MLYCLDTNIFVTAHRTYYAFDIVPGFWDALIELASDNHICSITPVYEEIVSKHPQDDALSNWVKSNRNLLFRDIDDETTSHYTDLADFAANRYEPQHYGLFLSCADSWIIAYSLSTKITVVTAETAKQKEDTNPKTGRISGRVKIPNMCTHFGVRSIDTYAFLRETKKSFR